LFSFWIKKSYKVGYFHAHDNLNKQGFFCCFYSCYPFVSRTCLKEKIIISREKVLAIVRNLKQQNQTLLKSIFYLQTNQVLTSLKCVFTTQPQP
jgi:hypothetical protein